MTEGPVIGGPPGPDAQLAGYRIQSVLGEGGMATVYLAERPQGGLCALKVLSTRRGQDLGYAARFKREAQYAEALNHPHILELYEAGEAPDGKLYLAMQYVPGADLAAVLARDGAMELARALALLGQVGDALDCAHAKGLIHRDVKPGNIIVATDGGSAPYAYLTDFGLSKNPDQDSIALTKQGQFVGTTAYTPPEEILAQERDHRIDVYSLGCVLFEALVGEPPFVRDQELDVMYAHIGDPRPRVSDRRPGLPLSSTRSSRRRWRYPPTTAIRAARSSSPRQVRCSPRGQWYPLRLQPRRARWRPRRRSRRRRRPPRRPTRSPPSSPSSR